MGREPKFHDEDPPGVNDHPFDPQGEWWSLCRHCGLARAAHFSSTAEAVTEMQAHFAFLRAKKERQGTDRTARYPAYVVPEEERDRTKIGYVSDDEDD